MVFHGVFLNSIFMKKIVSKTFINWFIVVCLVLQFAPCFAQVGINTNTPANSAALDIVSNSKGLLIPRLEGSSIASMTGMANGLLVYAVSTSGIINSIGFWYFDGSEWKKLGKSGTFYENDGTLVSNRTVQLSDKNLTFASTTGRLIVDAPFEFRKSFFAKPLRIHPVSNSIVWQNDDVVVLLQNGHTGNVLLPNASLNTNRVIAISNKSGSARPLAFNNSTVFGVYNYENVNQLRNNTITWFNSDGVSWNIISDIPVEVVSNQSFAPNLQLVSKVGQSSNFFTPSELVSNTAFIDLQVTTSGTQFPYLVNIKSNFVNGYQFNSDIVTITQSPTTVRVFASGAPINFGTGTDSFTFSVSSLNGTSQLTTTVIKSSVPILNRLQTTATAAYSLRRIHQNHNGPLVRVFKSVSGVISEADINFIPNGNLDVSALMAFAGSDNVAIKTWYDQTGNGNDVTLTNNQFSIAPVIVSNGVMESISNRPSANFITYGFKSGGAIPSLTIGHCAAVVDITSAPNGVSRRLLGPTIQLTGNTGVSNYTISATGSILVKGITSATIGLGRTNLSVNFSSVTTYPSFFGNVAVTAQANAFPGKMSELILFSSNLPTADRQNLDTNQIAYFGL